MESSLYDMRSWFSRHVCGVLEMKSAYRSKELDLLELQIYTSRAISYLHVESLVGMRASGWSLQMQCTMRDTS